MALLTDLVPKLLRSTQRDLMARETDLPIEDVSGIAVLLGVAAELNLRPDSDAGKELPQLRDEAQECLDAAMRAVRRKRQSQ